MGPRIAREAEETQNKEQLKGSDKKESREEEVINEDMIEYPDKQCETGGVIQWEAPDT